MFKIADQIFRINHAEFNACIADGEQGWEISWTFDFSTEARDINDQTWEPGVSACSSLISLPEFDLWPGFELTLPDVAEETEDALFTVHLFDPCPLRQGRLKFGAWQGHRIDFTLTGLADLYADEDYQENLPITIHCSLPFDGIVVDETQIDAAESRIKQFFDRDQLGSPRQREQGDFLFPLNR
ncbi:MAG: hypothetical protein LBV45_00975 [Xanthomonadaceae bacterium]|nr:hypothetical protein [Xanthomonadaceae bacterium]